MISGQPPSLLKSVFSLVVKSCPIPIPNQTSQPLLVKIREIGERLSARKRRGKVVGGRGDGGKGKGGRGGEE